jgi:hypothetical protein
MPIYQMVIKFFLFWMGQKERKNKEVQKKKKPAQTERVSVVLGK